MDIAEFRERMQDEHAEREQQQRYDRWVRILVLCSIWLIAFSLCFALLYHWYIGSP